VNVVAVIQARMGSTRLPGKVLAPIAGQSMLALVCRRVRRATRIDRLVVATTDAPADEPIIDECERLAVDVFRGSETDVLRRYREAAQRHAADAVVRITADCPLIDPEVIDTVVAAFLDLLPDYASNTLRRTWPRGLDTEVMTAAALARADREATEPYERVHVTPYLYRHPELFRLHAVTAQEDRSAARWTVDAPEDLALVRAVCERVDPVAASWRDVWELVAREPAVAALNRNVRQKELGEG
jgi:spore coat polysaccharide biosynthesis protein SpsF